MNTSKNRLRWLAAWALVWAGCDAQFVDERSVDTLQRDVEAAPDGLGEPDAAEPGTSEILASGSWEGRQGYAGEGTVELVRDPQGNHVLQLGEDFSVSGVPAPVVVLSERETIGKKIEPQDLRLGELSSNSGAQQYALPSGTVVDRLRYAWVYCEPFGIEVARADLR